MSSITLGETLVSTLIGEADATLTRPVYGILYGTGIAVSLEEWRASLATRLIPIVLIILASAATLSVGLCGFWGALPATTIGWTVLSLSVGGYILKLALGKLDERAAYIVALTIVALAFATIGTLGGLGILSAKQIAWGVVGTSLASVVPKAIGMSATWCMN